MIDPRRQGWLIAPEQDGQKMLPRNNLSNTGKKAMEPGPGLAALKRELAQVENGQSRTRRAGSGSDRGREADHRGRMGGGRGR